MEYPIYCKCIATHTNEGMIVKFTSLKQGDLVIASTKPGATSLPRDNGSWTQHTDKSVWVEVEDPFPVKLTF